MTIDAATSHRHDITATSFLIRLWDERLFLAFAVAVCVALAGLYIAISPQKFTATALIMPVQSTNTAQGAASGGLPSALSLLGGQRQENPKFELFLTIIRTERFGRYLQNKYHFVGRSVSGYTVKSFPQLVEILRSIVVTRDQSSNTATLSLQLSSRQFAKSFLLKVINSGNAMVRAQDSMRAEKLASYVEGKFKSETSRAIQDALASLLISQERFLMLTQVNLPYAAELLDGPTVSTRPTSPKKLLLISIGIVAGVCLGITAILLWDSVADERRSRGHSTAGLSDSIRALPKRMWPRI